MLSHCSSRRLAIAVACALSAAPAFGAIQWSGLGANNNWSTGANWVGGAAPTAAQDAQFEATGLANRQPTINATGSVTGIQLDATPTITLTNFNADFTVSGPVTGSAGLVVTASATSNHGRLVFTNTTSNFAGGLTVQGTGIARYNSGASINTSFGSSDITIDGGTFSFQGPEININASTGAPTGGGGADRSLTNNIVVTSTGGTLNMNQGSGNGGQAVAFNTVTLGGPLQTSSSGGGNADGYTIAGTVTLMQDAARTLRITNATGHNGSDWISGAIVDGAGAAGNPLRLGMNGRPLQISSAASTYAGGTIIEAGGGNRIDITSTAVLGTGGLTVDAGGKVRLMNPTALASAGNLAVGQTIAAAAGSAVGVGTNTNIADRFTAGSAGVYGVDAVTHNYALDMSTLGNGQMFLGSVSGGTYSGTSLTAGAGSTYRLGGGTSSGGLANLLLTGTNALTGSNAVVVGSGLNNNASFGRTIIGANQDVVGSVTINTDGLLATKISGGTPFGDASNSIEVFGTLAATGLSGVFSAGVIDNTVFRPGSTLEFNNLPDYANSSGGNNADRWDDSKGVTLNGSTVLLFGARSADSTETIGDVDYNGNAQVQTRRNGTSGQDVSLTLASVARSDRGVLRINPGTAANLGADLSNSSERVVVTDTTGLNISNGMVAPYIVDTAGNNFLQYDASAGVNFPGTRGLRAFTYVATNLNTAGATDVVNQSGVVSLSTNPGVFALRYNDTINVTSGNDTITLGSGGVLAVGNNKTNNAIMTSGATELIYWAVGGTQTFANNAAIQTTGGFTKAGGSTLSLTNSNAGANYAITGGIVIQQGVLTSGSRFTLALDDNLLTVNHEGRLNLNNFDTTVLGLAGVGLGADVYNGGANARTLTIDLAAGSASYEGRIQGSGSTAANLSLVKMGAGTQVFADSFRGFYDGTTAVNDGMLLVNGILSGTGLVSVAPAGTLGGYGSIAGVISVDGTLAPGASAGVLTGLSHASFGSGALLAWELDMAGIVGPAGGNDLLSVGGDLTLDGTLVVSQGANFGVGTYRLINYTGSLTDNTLDLQPAFVSAWPGSYIDTATAGQVDLVVIPEPTALALLAVPALLALRRRARCG